MIDAAAANQSQRKYLPAAGRDVFLPLSLSCSQTRRSFLFAGLRSVTSRLASRTVQRPNRYRNWHGYSGKTALTVASSSSWQKSTNRQ
jgi:hypothetical protein